MRLPWVSRDSYTEMLVMYERRLLDAKQERVRDQEHYDRLFTAYEKLRNTGHQPPPPPAPKTFADPAEEVIVKAEDQMKRSLVQQFRQEGHSDLEAETAAEELFEAWHGGAL